MSIALKSFLRSSVMVAFAAGSCVNSFASNNLYGDAIELYRTKHYDKAADTFTAVVQQQPTNATAAYYGACSYYGAGKVKPAINLFWYIVKKCPSAKEATDAWQYLKKIDRHYSKSSTDPSVGTLPQSVNSASVSVASAATRSDSGLDKTQLVERIVQVTPRRSNRPDVTKAFIKEVKDSLQQFPAGILKLLDDHNCRVVLAPCVVEKDFRIEKLNPRGYGEGSLMENAPALFDGRDIVVGQYYTDHSGNLASLDGVIGALRHESGHAIDWFSGHLSAQEEFKHAYEWDRPNLTQNKKLAYFSQPGDGGASETFAELCCYFLGGETVDWRQENCNAVFRCSERSAPIVKRIVDGLAI